ncbi:MAG: hypothetical protein J4F41_09315 [Alphaproteobacteria bacterium]|nr:hypothetical protein [Alphaproteobacteria bacterium]
MAYTDQDLDDAVKAGVVSAKHVAAFRHFMQNQRNGTASSEEHFRMITGFNDVFVTIACLLVLAAGWYIGSFANDQVGALAAAAGSWGLAEYFTRIRRMALPSITLLMVFVTAAFATFDFIADGPLLVLPPLAAMLAAAGHWLRFRVPITIAAVAASGIVAVMALMTEMEIDLDGPLFSGVLLALGLMTLGLAIWWDSRNVHRITRQADVAFWLHILSSFVIVHTLFSNILLRETQSDGMVITIVLLAYGLLTLVSIILDRRAMMVSALGYALYATGHVFTTDNAEGLGFALACLIVGGGLLMLSALWSKVRKPVVGLLPHAMASRLPPAY